jgi:hypothetical protein
MLNTLRSVQVKFALCQRGNLSFEEALKLIESGSHSFEYKMDGIRAMMEIDVRSGHVDLFTRNGMSLAPKFPQLVDSAKRMVQRGSDVRGYSGSKYILDGELISTTMQHRDIQAAVASNNPATGWGVIFCTFDLLATPQHPEFYKNNYRLRKSELTPLVYHHLDVVNIFQGPELFKVAWEEYAEVGGEGFVIKNNFAPYTPGHSNDWFRAKYSNTITAMPLDVGDDLMVDLSLWTGEGCGSVHVGRVQVPEDDLLLILNDKYHTISLEIEAYGYDERTAKLRHPTFKGIRWDIDMTTCTIDQLDSLRSF